MSKVSVVLLLISMFYANLAFSQLFDGKTLTPTDLAHFASQVKPGTVVFFGENHGIASHRDQHVEVLKALRASGLKVSVGLEFINYTDQLYVDQYRAGQITEKEFLTAIDWGGYKFDFYRPQLTFPMIDLGERSLGLNLTRDITSKISRNGLASLTKDEISMMPPNFQVGRDSYKARFMEAAGIHCRVPDNCFAAQSAWDDTMAWQAVKFIEQNPEQVLVVVVGDFHVAFGGGTPHRVSVRKPGAHIVTLSQIWGKGMTDEEIQKEMQPSEVDGPRADFIWVSKP